MTAEPRGAAIGYAMVAVAATLFAVGAPVVKVIEQTGFNAQRLTELRSTGAFVGFALIALVTRPETLAITRRELLLVAALGVMSILWMAVVAALIFAQKLLPRGEVLARIFAVAFVSAGIWIAAAPGTVPGLTQPGTIQNQMQMNR